MPHKMIASHLVCHRALLISHFNPHQEILCCILQAKANFKLTDCLMIVTTVCLRPCKFWNVYLLWVFCVLGNRETHEKAHWNIYWCEILDLIVFNHEELDYISYNLHRLIDLCRPCQQAGGDPFIWIRCVVAGKHPRLFSYMLLRILVQPRCAPDCIVSFFSKIGSCSDDIVFTVAPTKHQMSCDNGEYCHWSIAVLEEHHVSMTTSQEQGVEKHDDTITTGCWPRVDPFSRYYLFVLL